MRQQRRPKPVWIREATKLVASLADRFPDMEPANELCGDDVASGWPAPEPASAQDTSLLAAFLARNPQHRGALEQPILVGEDPSCAQPPPEPCDSTEDPVFAAPPPRITTFASGSSITTTPAAAAAQARQTKGEVDPEIVSFAAEVASREGLPLDRVDAAAEHALALAERLFAAMARRVQTNHAADVQPRQLCAADVFEVATALGVPQRTTSAAQEHCAALLSDLDSRNAHHTDYALRFLRTGAGNKPPYLRGHVTPTSVMRIARLRKAWVTRRHKAAPPLRRRLRKILRQNREKAAEEPIVFHSSSNTTPSPF